MTREQKSWLDAHPEYAPVGRTCGFASFAKPVAVKPDGTFRYLSRGHHPETGEMHVGIPRNLLPEHLKVPLSR